MSGIVSLGAGGESRSELVKAATVCSADSGALATGGYLQQIGLSEGLVRLRTRQRERRIRTEQRRATAGAQLHAHLLHRTERAVQKAASALKHY